MFKAQPKVSAHLIQEDIFSAKEVKLYLLREDLIHPIVSGNKWRKLHYNIDGAIKEGHNTLLTYGGAYSNHILAVACAAQDAGLNAIGVIRGEENLPLNPTLAQASSYGMQLHYVSREEYKHKNDRSFVLNLEQLFGSFYLLPEGGSNALAVKGCAEIGQSMGIDFDVICAAVGTGGTLAGIVVGHPSKEVLGFPALKSGEFLENEINALIEDYRQVSDEYNSASVELISDYHFGGYAKVKPELIEFVKQFKQKHGIELDLIYTGKMLFGIYDLVLNSDRFNGKTIIAVHTGGIQGNRGFEERLGILI